MQNISTDVLICLRIVKRGVITSVSSESIKIVQIVIQIVDVEGKVSRHRRL